MCHPRTMNRKEREKTRHVLVVRLVKGCDARNVGIKPAEKLTSTKESDTSRIAPSSIRSDQTLRRR
jgi:hypothetical protein